MPDEDVVALVVAVAVAFVVAVEGATGTGRRVAASGGLIEKGISWYRASRPGCGPAASRVRSWNASERDRGRGVGTSFGAGTVDGNSTDCIFNVSGRGERDGEGAAPTLIDRARDSSVRELSAEDGASGVGVGVTAVRPSVRAPLAPLDPRVSGAAADSVRDRDGRAAERSPVVRRGSRFGVIDRSSGVRDRPPNRGVPT